MKPELLSCAIMENLNSCSFGILDQTPCHLTTYTTVKTLKNFSDLSEDNKDLILLRSSINFPEGQESTICGHHSYYYLNKNF